jgi:hypothetical protein
MGLLRGAIESRASDALGRDVRVGALALALGIHPRLAIEDLHLAHVLSDRPEVLRVERMELELGLLPLIGRRLHVRRAAVDGVAVRIDPEAFPEGAPEAAPSEEPKPEARVFREHEGVLPGGDSDGCGHHRV